MNTAKENKIFNNSLTLSLFLILLVTNVVMIWAIPFGMVQIERLCSYVVLLGAFLLFLLSFLQKSTLTLSDGLLAALVVFIFVVSLCKGWSFSNYVVTLVFISMLTVWRSAEAIFFDEKIQKFVFWIFFIQGLILIRLYFSPLAYKSYQEYVDVSNELTLGFSNPNQTGLVLFSTLVVLLLLGTKSILKKVWKYAVVVEIFFLSVLLLLTAARTSILAYLFFLFFVVFRRKKVFKSKALANLILLFSVAFVYIYIALSKTIMKDFIILGKKMFSGREELYQEVLSEFTDKFFGNLTHFNFQNSHNAMLTVMINIGIIGFIIYFVFTVVSFNRFYDKCKSRDQVLCGIAILAFFLMSCAEAAVLTGGSMYYVHTFVILVLANTLTASGDT